MMGQSRFEDLQVWQRAMTLVERVYTATATFPSDERFGLTQQLRRAAVSIPSNIAEGQGRASNDDFIRFLVIARGSLNEVATQLVIAERLVFLPAESAEELRTEIEEIKRMLNGLIRSLG